MKKLMKKIRNTLVGICFFLFLTFLFYFSNQLSISRRPVTKERFLLDTLVTIKVFDRDRKEAEESIEKAFLRMKEVEKKLNYFDAQSELSKLNRTRKIKASKELWEIVSLSQKYAKKTNGYFDISIGKLMDLWGFAHQGRIPSSRELLTALHSIGFEKILLEKKGKIIKLNGMVKVDLGGVAKGYAVDLAIEALKKNGIKNALVTAGSSTKVIGKKPNGLPWRVGIENPREKGGIIATLNLSDGDCISTSGDYQKFFIKGGKRYHHILNPKEGKPSKGFMSVSILTKDSCALSDILSTAVFAQGYHQGMKFLKENKIKALVVNSKGEIFAVNGLENKGEIKQNI